MTCPTCNGGIDEYYNTPGAERDAPCPDCHGTGEEWEAADERAVKWDAEQTEYLRQRLSARDTKPPQ